MGVFQLAKNKRIQDKLRKSLLETMPTMREFDYDHIMENEYLDQVFNGKLI